MIYLYKHRLLQLVTVVVVSCVSVSTASAGIFKCTDKQTGEINYNDKPCKVEQNEKELQADKVSVKSKAIKPTEAVDEVATNDLKQDIVKKSKSANTQVIKRKKMLKKKLSKRTTKKISAKGIKAQRKNRLVRETVMRNRFKMAQSRKIEEQLRESGEEGVIVTD